ncbi:hypothetical protein [Streptomyces sp. NPDC058066]|uniref:hypothetical protein n=1 Tax=Streptomyces sp. NPDC058066 TaxID=3346323 RepID=UPI0036ECB33E
MNEPRPQRPPRPDEDLERFHNGDTLDNIPIITVRPRVRQWKPALTAVVVGLVLLASGYALVAHPKGSSHADNEHPASPASKKATPTVTVTPQVTHATSPTPSPTPSGEPSASPSALAEPSCINVLFKLPTGPQSCEPKSAICELGSPMYLPTIDNLCGPAPIARVYIPNIDAVERGGCLALKSTNWATATAEYKGSLAPAAECAAFIDVTETEAGAPIVFCQQTYPDTRATFLAAITTPSGTTSACLTANNGA